MFKALKALSDTGTLELLGPDGTPAVVTVDESDIDPDTGEPRQHQMTIELLRADSAEAQKFQNRRKNERLARASAAGKLVLTQESLDREALDLLVYCTRGWTHFYSEDGAPVPFTAENVRKLYSNKAYSWLYNQVDSFINSAANFAGN